MVNSRVLSLENVEHLAAVGLLMPPFQATVNPGKNFQEFYAPVCIRANESIRAYCIWSPASSLYASKEERRQLSQIIANWRLKGACEPLRACSCEQWSLGYTALSTSTRWIYDKAFRKWEWKVRQKWEKTAFRRQGGTLNMWWCPPPATFQSLMKHILKAYLRRFVLFSFLIYSSTHLEEAHRCRVFLYLNSHRALTSCLQKRRHEVSSLRASDFWGFPLVGIFQIWLR